MKKTLYVVALASINWKKNKKSKFSVYPCEADEVKKAEKEIKKKARKLARKRNIYFNTISFEVEFNTEEMKDEETVRTEINSILTDIWKDSLNSLILETC